MRSSKSASDQREVSASILFNESDPPSKRAVLAAALKLFVREGYESTTIRDIAAEAGYTNPALFKFFKTKEDLGVYLFERTYSVLLDELEPYFKQEGKLEDVLSSWVDSYLLLLGSHIDAFLFVHDSLTHFWPKVSKRLANRDLFKLMHEWLQDGRERGAISKALPVAIQTAAVSGFFHQFAKMIYLKEADLRQVESLKKGAHEVLMRILGPGASATVSRRNK